MSAIGIGVPGCNVTRATGNLGSAVLRTWYSSDKVKTLSLFIYSGLS